MDIVSSMMRGDVGVFALGLVLAGVVSGLVSGVLGFGSGIVVVPVLYSVLVTLGLDRSVRMHIAVATSLAALVPASLAAAIVSGQIAVPDRALLIRWVIPAVVGALAGSALAAYSGDRILLIAFATVSLVVATHLVFVPDNSRDSSQLSQFSSPLTAAAVIGGVSAMTGIDGGTLSAPTRTLFGISPERAASMGAVLNVLGAAVGAACAIVAGWHEVGLPVWSLGYVNLLGLGLILPGMLLAAPVGARFVQTADTRRMRLVFALFIVVAGARFLFDALA
ncbi:MAG: sulfite exporter TauE/SafE family protein [Rhizomicrobium sp.]